MTRIARITTALGLAVLAVGAQAQSLYGEIGYTGLDYREPGLKVSPGMVRGVVGYDISPNLAVEGMLGLDGGSDTASGTTLRSRCRTCAALVPVDDPKPSSTLLVCRARCCRRVGSRPRP